VFGSATGTVVNAGSDAATLTSAAISALAFAFAASGEAKEEAEAARDAAVLAKDDAVIEKDDAAMAKDDAVIAKDDAVLAKDVAVLARDAAIAAASSIDMLGSWYQSPDYELGTHPNDNTGMRWAHLQPDPIAIYMFVRVRDTSNLQRGQHIYPYSDIRVQPRYSPVGGGLFTRYVRFVQPGGTSTAITLFRVKIRHFDPNAISTTPAIAPLNITRVEIYKMTMLY
jgi:hypothetical protein